MLAILLRDARTDAGAWHAKPRPNKPEGDRYNGGPYTDHLDDVRSVAFEFGVIQAPILVGTLLHDAIEDTEATKEQIEAKYGPEVAALVYAVSDPPGHKNRKSRKAAVYLRILAVPGAVKLKLCDRIANVRSCWNVATADKLNKSKLGMYKKEYGGFRKALRPHGNDLAPDPVEQAMWDELDRLLAWKL